MKRFYEFKLWLIFKVKVTNDYRVDNDEHWDVLRSKAKHLSLRWDKLNISPIKSRTKVHTYSSSRSTKLTFNERKYKFDYDSTTIVR